jgi:phosphoribosylanthranilate isomerase
MDGAPVLVPEGLAALQSPVMRTRIKICGIRDVETAQVCVNAGVDAVGLVFVPGSPREVTVEQAAKVIESLPAFVTALGLFVDVSADRIREVCRETGISQVQLHGKETATLAKELGGLGVMKAVAFGEGFLDAVKEWKVAPGERAPVNALVVDTPPTVGHRPGEAGGTGRAFDWMALKEFRDGGGWARLPELVLAGGLRPENVRDAVRLLAPYAVDVSSGVESSRGVKSAALIRAFCDGVRLADRE